MSSVLYRCAVVGCGWIGAKVSADPLVDGIQSHAGAFEACHTTELVALCDTDLAQLTWAHGRWPRARAYTNLQEMLHTENLDIISVCTPDRAHYSVAQQIINASPTIKALIIEKPLAMDSLEAKTLLLSAEKKNILVMVNYSRRFASSHEIVKQRIMNGEIGEILTVSGNYSKGVLHNGSHWFDLARWLIGEVDTVEAWESRSGNSADPTCHVRMQFTNGAQGFLIGMDANKFSIFELDILGSCGRFRIRDSGHKIEYSQVQKSNYYQGYTALSEPEHCSAGFLDVTLSLIQNTTSVLEGYALPLCSGKDGLAALTIAEAAKLSLLRKKIIKIGDNLG